MNKLDIITRFRQIYSILQKSGGLLNLSWFAIENDIAIDRISEKKTQALCKGL
jgi:hypothetical protein